MRLYKMFGIAAAAVFAVVGFIFLFFPDSALVFFNSMSGYFGLPESDLHGAGFYLALASAYMYLVALLAYLMYRYPEQDIYPFLLAHGKLASSVISIYLFLMHKSFLIYFANFAVDGLLGIAVLCLMKVKKRFKYDRENNADIRA